MAFPIKTMDSGELQSNLKPNSISVVIPTIGRNDVLRETLEGLIRQGNVTFELIIVTQSEESLDDVRELAEQNHTQVRCFYQSEPNASLARNVGLRNAKHPVVLFIDDDMRFENNDYLENHLAHYFNDDTLAGVAGQVLTPGQLERTKKLHRFASRKRVGWLYSPPNWHQQHEIRNGISCNLSVRREFAVEVGGMDARFVRGAHREESDFCLRLSDHFGPLLFSPAARAIHLHVASGGCRSWNEKMTVQPNTYASHHLAGEWYFILNGLKIGTVKYHDLPDYLIALFRRQIWNRPNGQRFRGLIDAIRNSLAGRKTAREWVANGPRLIDSLSKEEYTLVWQTSIAMPINQKD